MLGKDVPATVASKVSGIPRPAAPVVSGHRRRRFADVLPEGIDAVARGGIAGSQSRLPAALRRLHRGLLRHMLATGRPPPAGALHRMAGASGLQAGASLRALAEADLVRLAPDGEVAAAYPLSGRPSPHRVELGRGFVLNATCAIGALGIPLMTGRPATIVSRDPGNDRRITVRFDGTHWHWQPPGAVVLLAAVARTGPLAVACLHTGFHATAPDAHAYLHAHPSLAGQVLNKIDAVEIAHSEFGPLLHDDLPT
ncbi:organomercurial lyase [Amycolatopsis sp. lyj-346]|uniref:organomercurial lyase n=1 Tax=Amycolatopsis sp. lyj-346 TaxID=2789289 RepID=UPI00397964B7